MNISKNTVLMNNGELKVSKCYTREDSAADIVYKFCISITYCHYSSIKNILLKTVSVNK